jgi:hypothetical protein
VNLLRDNIDTIKKNMETLIDASKEIGLEVNTERAKYTLLSRQQNAGHNHDIRKADRCFENMAKFRYLSKNRTNQNLIQKEINSRLNSGNVYYHSAQKLLSSRLLSQSIKIRLYETIILPVVLYGCETWFLRLRKDYRMRVFEKRVLRRIFRPKINEVTGECWNCRMRSFITCTPYKT